jgi:hypothetical protein
MIVLAGGGCYRLACVHCAAPGAVSRVGPGRRDQLLGLLLTVWVCAVAIASHALGQMAFLEVSSLVVCSLSGLGGLREMVR